MSSPPLTFGQPGFGISAFGQGIGAAATQLSIYNGACSAIGERQLVAASPGATYSVENRESRRALDDVWNRGGVRSCLSMGLWNFAARGVQWNYDPDLVCPWGYQCAFEIPEDWVRWMVVSVDPYMNSPLLQYTTEGSYFYCDLQMLWVKYVSSDPNYGMNLAAWPDSFQRYVELFFAAQICERITQDTKKLGEVSQRADAALKKAKSTDAQNEATAMLPPGMWRQARHGRRTGAERGNPFQLIG